MVETITIHSTKKKEIVDLTPRINLFLKTQKVKEGIIVVSVLHTTCCVTTGEVGEGTDDDLLEVAEKIIPQISFRHGHNPSHAWSHMASSIIGSSKSFIVQNNRVLLGTWQSIVLMELDGPRERALVLALTPT